MQQFEIFGEGEKLNVSYPKLIATLKTLLSSSSGAAFPTTELQVGQTCYRTDLKKVYRLTQIEPSAVWTFELDLSGVATAALANNLSATRNNWKTNGTESAVVGQLGWRQYGVGYTVFDVSSGTVLDGTAKSNQQAEHAWMPGYPMLVGWNGENTFGVRVDSARTADVVAWGGVSGKPTTVAGYGITDIPSFGGSQVPAAPMDWNSVELTKPGPRPHLVMGNWTNGPGPAVHFHVLSFNYAVQDGSGNVTQMAIPYGTSGNTSLWIRGRYNGTWSAWKRIWSEADLTNIVNTFNGRVGAVSLTLADVTGVGGATQAAVNNKADSGHTHDGRYAWASHAHSYAPMTAVVSIVKYEDSINRYIRYTRANGAVVDVLWANIAAGGGE